MGTICVWLVKCHSILTTILNKCGNRVQTNINFNKILTMLNLIDPCALCYEAFVLQLFFCDDGGGHMSMRSNLVIFISHGNYNARRASNNIC